MGDFNERQAQIIKLYADDSTALITIKDLQVKFGISPTTAKNDIIGLLKKKYYNRDRIKQSEKGLY